MALGQSVHPRHQAFDQIRIGMARSHQQSSLPSQRHLLDLSISQDVTVSGKKQAIHNLVWFYDASQIGETGPRPRSDHLLRDTVNQVVRPSRRLKQPLDGTASVNERVVAATSHPESRSTPTSRSKNK